MRFITRSVAVLGLAAASASAQTGLVNGDFETGEPGTTPAGWTVPAYASGAGYRAALMTEGAHEGSACVRLWRDAGGMGTGALTQTVDAAAYRGQRVEFRAAVRFEESRNAFGTPVLQLRIADGRGGSVVADNMADEPITGADWREYTVLADIGEDAAAITVELLLAFNGRLYMDGASLRAVGETPPPDPREAARPLSGRALENVAAFVRLCGYVRYFHPSDEAAAVPWERFMLRGIREVEDAGSAEELAAKLRGLFAPIVPTVLVVVDREGEEHTVELNPSGAEAAGIIGWVHRGFSPTGNTTGTYTSVRHRDNAGAPERILPAGTVTDVRLPGGVRCVVPVTLHHDAAGRTIPAPAAELPEFAPAPRAPARDRTTRLAAIGTAWNVYQHFYPYFDVVPVDWDAVLPEFLAAAAVDADETAFLATLRRLTGQLQDGHARAHGPGEVRNRSLPIGWAWVGEDLIVCRVPDLSQHSGLAPGDVVMSIGGRPVAELRAELEPRLSGAPQYRRALLRGEMALVAGDEPVEVRVRRIDGTEHAAELLPVQGVAGGTLDVPRPGNGAEIAPGVVYFDLTGTTTRDVDAVLEQLVSAEGVVFDARGYPNSAALRVIPLLGDKPMTSAQWRVATSRLPDRADFGFNQSNWDLMPAAPRITGKVAYITDGRAISYAESCMGIVEHYKLGEIVGEATAGANGNRNDVRIPGGYTISYTGMQVLKHDGSQHHLIGNLPTVPVERTIAGIATGRDELLERAVEVVKADRANGS